MEPHHALVPDLPHAHAAVTTLEALLPQLDYGADGVVVKVNPLRLHAELGTVGDREPRWAVARKFAPEVQVTKLKEIRINVGRTGALNPYAVLEPVTVFVDSDTELPSLPGTDPGVRTGLDHLVAEFSWGNMPHHEAELNMRLFADRVMPVLQRDPAFAGGHAPPELAAVPTKPAKESVFAPA